MDLPSQMLTQPMEELFKVPSFTRRDDAGAWALGERSCTTPLAKVPAQPWPEQRVPCHLKSSSVLFIIWSLLFPLKPEISKA